jgi:hypothetical protein
MELEPRTTAPSHATGAVAFVPLAALAADTTFRLRDEGDVTALAASIGRLGQIVPVELRPLPGAAGAEPRYQLVAGFRRIAALRMLMRERVLARIHGPMEDDDAWAIALGQALLTEPLDRDSLRELRERLGAERVAPWADELVDEALVRAPIEPELRERFFEFLGGSPVSAGDEVGSPGAAAEADAAEAELPDTREDEAESHAGEEGEVEMTPEELAEDLATRLYHVNSDLAVAFESWSELPPDGRRMIIEQAQWIAELLPLLERDADGEGE